MWQVTRILAGEGPKRLAALKEPEKMEDSATQLLYSGGKAILLNGSIDLVSRSIAADRCENRDRKNGASARTFIEPARGLMS